jgi:hypothetical protein
MEELKVASTARRWLRWLWPAPIAVLLVFLLVLLLLSPAARLLRSDPAQTMASGASGSDRQGPIVMVVMDEFPLRSLLDHRGRIDRRLYPNFARLSGESTWFRNATGVSGLTNFAMPAMLTGRYPAEDRLPIASQYPANLFTLLSRSYRYKLRVFEGTSQLCPPSICPDAKRGSEEATVDPAAGPAALADPGRRAEIVKGYTRGVGFGRFLSSIHPAGRDQRVLYFVHTLIPHQPWKYLPSGRKYPQRALGPGVMTDGRWTSEPPPVLGFHQRHLMQTAIADRMLGELVERLRATGLYDRSLLVVTADHGMAFKPGESARASVGNSTAPDVLWVPTFIKRPGQRTPSATDVNWEHVDLLPTITALLGVGVPWPVDGVSWADLSAGGRARTQKWFYPKPGDRQALEGPANQAVALHGVTDQLLRPQDGYLGWFRTGRHADLVGRRVDELAVAGSGGTARVIGLDDYRVVDLASGTVPAHVAGRLVRTAPGLPPRPAVVVAVNGVIGGASETFASGDPRPTWFAAMIPDSLMRQGDNRLELFALDTAGGRPRLHPLQLTR